MAKVLGVLLLLAPVGPRLNEWAYAGFAFTFVAAFLGHTAVGDPVGERFAPLVALAVLVTSYVCYHWRRTRLATPVQSLTQLL